MPLTITQTRTGGAEHSARALTDAVKNAARATVEYWHEAYLPKHFTVEGFEEYGYQPRKGQDEPNLIYSDRGTAVRMGRAGRLINNPHYYWVKWRRYHTHDPLVLTGRSRDRAKRSIRTNVQATAAGSVRASGVLDLDRYFYQYRKDLGQPDKADELFRTTPAEGADLTNYFNHHVAHELDLPASAPTTTTRLN